MGFHVQLPMARQLCRVSGGIQRTCKCCTGHTATLLSGYCAILFWKVTRWSLHTAKKCGGQSEPVQASSRGSVWTVEGQAGCMPWNLLLLLQLLLCCKITTSDLEVEMAEGTQMVFLHDNVTITCRVPGSPHLDIKTMGIQWFQKSESEFPVFEFYGNHLNMFRSGAMVSRPAGPAEGRRLTPAAWGPAVGSRRIPMQVGDHPEKAEGKSRLEGVARPTMKLSVEKTTLRNNGERHILCKVDGFYPEAISIKWEKCTPKDSGFQEITEGIVTGPTVKNDDGTFNVTSRLKLKSPFSGTICQCEVVHKSIHMSQRVNITLNDAKSPRTNLLWLLPLVCVLWLFLVVVAYCLCRRCRSSSGEHV